MRTVGKTRDGKVPSHVARGLAVAGGLVLVTSLVVFGLLSRGQELFMREAEIAGVSHSSRAVFHQAQQRLTAGRLSGGRMGLETHVIGTDPPLDLRTGQPEFNTETYDRILDNPFLGVRQNPLSTFSIAVDTASYANLRRYLTGGMLPPRDAVRIEEMVNYFSYGYPSPTGKVPFSLNVEENVPSGITSPGQYHSGQHHGTGGGR